MLTQAAIQYILTTVEVGLADLLSLSLIDPSCVPALREAISSLCVKLLPEAVYLSDAFGFSDWELDRCVSTADPRCWDDLSSPLVLLVYTMVMCMKSFGNRHRKNLLTI
jgi:hypothetical protein